MSDDLDLDLLTFERCKHVVQRSYDGLPIDIKREVTAECIRTGLFTADVRIVGADVEFWLGGHRIAVVEREVLTDPDALLDDLSMTWMPEAPDDTSGLED